MRVALMLTMAGCGWQQNDDAEPTEAHAPVVAPEPVALTLPSEPVWPADPDADYPLIADDETARLMMEEPERGPLVLNETAPLPAGLTTTRHAYCEVLPPNLMCSPPVVEAEGGAPWMVRRVGPVVHMAQRELPRSDEPNTWRWVYSDSGGLVRLDVLGPQDRVEVAYTFSEDEMFYRARERSGANGLDGCGIWNLEDDFDGRIIAETCLGWNGAPKPDAGGIVTRLHAYDDAGFIRETSYTDASGVPMAAASGVATVRYERDAVGRPMTETRLAADGTGVVSAQDGCAGVARTYTDSGALASSTCLGPEGAPMLDSDGVATQRREYNADHQLQAITAHDVAGARVNDRLGVSARHYTHGSGDRVVREVCFDKEGNPTECAPGGAERVDTGYVSATDDSSERRYRTADGSPSHDPDYGVFAVIETLDEQGRAVTVQCRDDQRRNVDCGGTGYSRLVRTFDDAGRVTRSTFFGPAGRPASSLGTTERRFAYDHYDRTTEVRELSDGAQATSYAVQRLTYDASGRLDALLLFDDDYAPVDYPYCFTGVACPESAWHAMRVVRQANGAVTSNVFYDAQGHRVAELTCETGRCWE